jgi:integrase
MNLNKPVSGFVYAKQRVVHHIASAEPWRLHDLRRTCVTGLARLGVPLHVADKILNHQSGSISGVAAVYNRFSYLDARREALCTWGNFVEALVYPERAQRNVVEMRAR